jgi:hypothetical protein
MTDQPNIVTFGKYKGRTIEELLEDDPGYLQWLVAQDWFRAKFVTLHQTIINRGTEPEETPEHNALQVLFLDEEFCRRFIRHLYPDWGKGVIERGEYCRQKRIDELTASLSRERPWNYGEQYLRQWDEARNNERNELAECREAPEFSVVFHAQAEFERDGADALVTARATAVAKNGRVWATDCLDTTTIEVKPTVSDDYPAVLRQMRRARTKVLFLGQYTGKGASQEQFIQTFKTANITVVFRDVVASQRGCHE